MKIYDGKGLIAGRLAVKVAKDLIAGEEVCVINAESIVYSGKHSYHVSRLASKRLLKDKKDPEKSPKFPRVPYMLFKRAVMGMLPKKSQRGRDALARLKVYNDAPKEIDASKAISDQSIVKKNLLKSTTLGKICAAFGFEN